MEVSGNLDKLLKENKMIFNSWFKSGLVFHIPKLMNHPEWFCGDSDIKPDDVVLFSKQDGVLSNTYQYGICMINKILPSNKQCFSKIYCLLQKSSGICKLIDMQDMKEL